ncbi:17-beta-hydroxysteroid dehydrogenase 13-like [Cydia splendana]|uniref:17-beta-hydroxysteroid dehydrogenase 13-like n=1 Tax=Cydia splendana TaxID=1100963 RepID=UPI00212C09DB
MADEPTVIAVWLLTVEVISTLLRIIFELVRGIYLSFVPPAPKDVSGEIILITGAGHGMGREVAIRFAKLGATIVCVDINKESNQETVDLIKEAKGTAHRFEADVTDREAVFKLAQRVTIEVGDVTILVNNAGIMPCKPLLRWSEQEVRSTMDINVNGNIWMIQAFLPTMLERNYGHIVAMSSMAGMMPVPNLVPYCGSKFAVRAIMDTLALELQSQPRDASGLKFTTICPFVVNTGLCHRPKSRFPALIKTVETADAADKIVDAVRREIREISIPGDLHYLVRYFMWLVPFPVVKIINSFIDAGVNPHD